MALNLRMCMSCLNIFFMFYLGGFGCKLMTEAIASCSVPKPEWAGIGWYWTVGAAVGS